MIFSEILLPTHSLYKKPDLSAYDKAKHAFLQEKLPAAYFEAEPFKDKWDQLIQKFIESIPEQQDLFNQFKESRKNIQTNNRFNVQLSQMINYFENFYFLRETSNADYQLSPKKKQTVLETMLTVMRNGFCEPGIITRFENILQAMRQDTNWMTHELSQQRQTIIRQIADEYNATAQVPASMHIHTNMHMSKIAKSVQLGIEPDNEIEDPYLSLMDTQPITNYFHTNYPEKFKAYELELVKNLSHHCFSEFTQTLKNNGMNLELWEKGPLLLPYETENNLQPYQDLKALISTMLDVEIEAFGELDEKNCTDFYLHDRENCFKIIQNKVKEKLIRDGFLCPLDALNDKNAKHIRLSADVSLDALIEFKKMLSSPQDLQNPTIVAQRCQQSMNLLRYYPELLSIPLKEYPFLWDSLPRSMKANPFILDKLTEQLGRLLKDSLKKFDRTEQEKIIAVLSLIENEDPDYLKDLNIESDADRDFALLLAKKNGRLIQWLPEHLRHDREVIQNALNTNQLADPRDLNTRLHESSEKLIKKEYDLPQHPFSPGNDTETVNQIKKNQSILTLIETPNLPIGQLIILSKNLTPFELLQAIKKRQELDFPELPHCRMNPLQSFMNQFELNEQTQWKDRGYLALKRLFSDKVSARTIFYKKNIARECIQESNQWMYAFLAYQKRTPMYDERFKNFRDVLLQLKMSAKALLALLKSFSRFLLEHGKELLLYGAIFYGSSVFAEKLNTWAHAAFHHVIDKFGLLMPTLFYGISLFLIIDHLGKLQKPGRIITASLLALSALFFPEILMLISLEASIFYLLFTGAKHLTYLISKVLGYEWSWNEISTFFNTAVGFYLFSEFNFYAQLLLSSLSFVVVAVCSWSQLIVAATLPWVTRSWASLTAQGDHPSLTDKDRMKAKIEENILSLLEAEDPEANQKGALLNRLWDTIQAEVAQSNPQLSYQEALDRKYPVEVGGRPVQASFQEISNVRRIQELSSSPSEPLLQRLSFFGRQSSHTTTEHSDIHLQSTSGLVAAT